MAPMGKRLLCPKFIAPVFRLDRATDDFTRAGLVVNALRTMIGALGGMFVLDLGLIVAFHENIGRYPADLIDGVSINLSTNEVPDRRLKYSVLL